MKVLVVCVLLSFSVVILAYIDVKRILILGRELEEMMGSNNRYKGNKFFKKLLQYSEFLKMVYKNVDEYKTIGIKYYKALEKEKGPPFLNIELDPEFMFRRMNLTAERANETMKIINETRELWKQMQSVYASRKHEDETCAVLVDKYYITNE